VVYLRRALGISDSQPNEELSKKLSKKGYLFIDKVREGATILMFVTLAFLVGETWVDIIVVFLWTFAFWDLFYYVFLYILIKWPPKLSTIDVLFLIPHPWIAPVWVPVGISLITIITIAILTLSSVL
jgi:hypothetical protein